MNTENNKENDIKNQQNIITSDNYARHAGRDKSQKRIAKQYWEMFRKALLTVEKDLKVSLLEHAVREAYVDNNVLVALLKKLLPDMSEEVINDNRRIILIAPNQKVDLSQTGNVLLDTKNLRVVGGDNVNDSPNGHG